MRETPTERNRRIFEDATSKGEPVFVLRAKDNLSPDTIGFYRELADSVTDPEFRQALDDTFDQFMVWRQENPDHLKMPDLPS